MHVSQGAFTPATAQPALPLATRAEPPMAEVLTTSVPPAPPLLPALDLEQRVRRLEDALAQLQDGQRRTASAREEEGEKGRRGEGESAEAGVVVPAGPVLDTERGFGADNMLTSAPPDIFVPLRGATARPLLFELWTEARAIVRMYLDPHYRLSWMGRVVPASLLFLIITSGWWFPLSWLSLFGIGTVVDKALDLVLAYALYKVVTHEARRYREVRGP